MRSTLIAHFLLKPLVPSAPVAGCTSRLNARSRVAAAAAAAAGGGVVFSATRRLYQSNSQIQSALLGDKQIPLIRNIGIVAHIDAGKTTTTERMLFYAGKVKKIGEVDGGTTTTDYMQEEMERGITITSAAVTLEWRGHTVNLIDTPGHADFTVEVERALRVVDGVVALFDASAGVQAQSYTVLRQARKFETPLIAFINKMDKTSANFDKSVKSIREKLGVVPIVTQIPLAAVDGDFEGVVDVVALNTIRFSGPHGAAMIVTKISASEDQHLFASVQSRRLQMVETVANLDDIMSEKYLMALEEHNGNETDAAMSIRHEDLRAAIRRLTLKTSNTAEPVVPVLCGAARRDQGVQPLLDAVNDYLPSPLDRVNLVGFNSKNLALPLPTPSNLPTAQTIALVFKIIHALHKGNWSSLCFFRVYSGRVYPKQELMGVNSVTGKGYLELIDKVYVMHANNPVEVPFIGAGNIGAAFLQNPVTGDTLHRPAQRQRSLSSSGVKNLKTSSEAAGREENDEGPALTEIKRLEGISPPPAAISFCLEAPADRQLAALDQALKSLCREDPSLRQTTNEHRQIILSGMGELHLEIILSRLSREYQIPCKLLRAIVEYRESFTVGFNVDEVEGSSNSMTIAYGSFRVDSVIENNSAAGADDTVISVDNTPLKFRISTKCEDAINNASGIVESQKKSDLSELKEFGRALQKSMELCGKCGPLAGLPSIGLTVTLESWKNVASVTLTQAQMESASRQMMQEVFKACRVSKLVILEPMMRVEVCMTEAAYLGDVISCLNGRGSVFMDASEDSKSVVSVVPMRNILKFNTDLRKVAKGNAYFWMSVDHYRTVTDEKVKAAILRNRGITE